MTTPDFLLRQQFANGAVTGESQHLTIEEQSPDRTHLVYDDKILATRLSDGTIVRYVDWADHGDSAIATQLHELADIADRDEEGAPTLTDSATDTTHSSAA